MQDFSKLEALVTNPAKLQNQLDKVVDVAVVTATSYGLMVIGAIVILVVGWSFSGFVHNAIVNAGRRTQRLDLTIFTFMGSLARYAILTFTIVAMLGTFGVQTTSFVAVLGAAGLAVGLALQGTLSHVASGFMLIVFRPFRIGDQIEAGGVAGTVRSITLFVTEIDTADNVHIILPNGLVWSKDIKNYSANANRRLELKFMLPYGDNLDKAIGVIQKVLANNPQVLREPAPVVGVQSMNADGLVLSAGIWTARQNYGDLPVVLNTAVKNALAGEGMGMSFPQRVLSPPNPEPPKA